MPGAISLNALRRSVGQLRYRVLAVGLAVAATLLSVNVALAAVINVTTTSDTVDANGGNCGTMTVASLPGPDGVTSLREAICAANRNTGADTINVPAGTYTLTRVGNDDTNVNGDLDVLNGNLTIVGAGSATTIVQAGNNNRVFDINHGGGSTLTVSISGLTIRNGNAPSSGNPDGGGGGGIRVDRTQLTLTNDIITSNTAARGGGIQEQNDASVITMTGTTVSNNTANASGFGGNNAGGGGINVEDRGDLHVNASSLITGNATNNEGGGIRVQDSADVWVDNSSVNNNSTTNGGDGGGISLSGGGDNGNRTLTISNNGQVNNNTAADDGGGIDINNDNSTVVIQNAQVNGNHSSDDGGGIRISGRSDLSITTSTVSLNTAEQGAGISGNDGGGGGGDNLSVTVTGSTIGNNTASGGPGGGIHIEGGQSDLTVSGGSVISGNIAQQGGDGGGVDAEDFDTVTLNGVTISGNIARTGTTNCSGGGSSFGGGVRLSNNGVMSITGATTISGNTACSGGGGISQEDSARLTITATSTASVIISGNSTAAGGGGGIRQVATDTLTINGNNASGSGAHDVEITGNTATAGGGGGIFISGTTGGFGSGSPTDNISFTTIANNTASAGGGGGIFATNGSNGNTTLNIDNSTISGNTATGANGGGILQAVRNLTSRIRWSTISGNTANGVGLGGGLFRQNSTAGGSSTTGSLTLLSVTMVLNTANGSGGAQGAGSGMNIQGSNNVSVTNSLISDNAGGADCSFSQTSGYTSGNFNLIGTVAGGTNCNTVFNGAADQKNVASGIDTNLINNGGSTATHALLPGSNAIDKGRDTNSTDQRGTGFPRPVDIAAIPNAPGGNGADIGAYEVHMRGLTVNGAGDGTGDMNAPLPTGGAGIIACHWNGAAKSGTCAQTGNDTTTYIITATPVAGSNFTGWTGCDSTTGPTDPVTGADTVCIVKLITDKTVTGHFTKSFLLTVNGAGDGTGTMTTAAPPTGTINNINCAWDGNATSGACTATGLDTSVYVITATPDVSSAFTGWTGCDTTSGPTDPITAANTVCNVRTNSAKTVTGHFQKKFGLTVTGAGDGVGTMKAPKPVGAPTGIDCGWNGTTTTGTICAQTAIDTTVFVITAAPDAASSFTGWDGCDTTDGPTDPVTGAATICHVTVSSAKTVTGNFTKKFGLIVKGAGDGKGTMVAPPPTGILGTINCAWNGTATSGTCTATGLDTSTFIITATPDASSAFTGWDNCDSTSGPADPTTGADTVCNVTTSSAKTVTGHFTKKFDLTVDGAGDGTGTMVAPAPSGILGTISCAWDSAATSGTCTATGLDTSTFIITTTPDAGSAFTGWTGCDSTGGPADPTTGANTVCNVTTSSAKTVTGHFTKKFDLTVDGAGDGTGTMVAPAPGDVLGNINCAWDGTATSGTCTATGLDTTTFVITATPDAGSAFTGWDNCDSTGGPTDPVTGADTVCIVKLITDKTVTGHFTKSFLLTVNGAGDGTGTMATAAPPTGTINNINCAWDGNATSGACTATGLDTSVYVITATPDVGSAFTGWTGCDSTGGPADPTTGADTVCNVTTSSAKTVTGNFTKKFDLTVDGAGDGTGTMVAPAPGDVLGTINCAWDGTATSGTCTATGLDTTTFVITATPGAGSAFTGWTGCDSTGGPADPTTGADTVCNVTTSSAKTVTGHFTKSFLLTVKGAGDGTGTMVAPAPGDVLGIINCNYNGATTSGTCTATGLDTTTFVITATPDVGSAFTGWDNCDSTSGPADPTTGADTVCTVTTSSAKTVTGNFTKKFDLTVKGAGDGTGTMIAPVPTGVLGGINCAWDGAATSGTCSATGLDTTTFVITATPDTGSAFTGWTGCDTTSGPTDPVTGANTVCNVTTSSAKTVTGHFTKSFLLTVKGAGNGSGNMSAPAPTGTITNINCGWNGTATSGACTATGLDTSTYIITATPSVGSTFVGWTGCDSTGGPTDPVTGANTVCTVTTSSAKTVTGNFARIFLLTVAGAGSGTGTMVAPAPTGVISGISCTSTAGVTSGDCTQSAFITSAFVIMATPNAGTAFSGWAGCDTTSGPTDPVTGADTVCNVTTSSAKTVTGTFRLTHILTVTGAGNGTGTMTALQPVGAPGGISCGWNGAATTGAPCSETAADTTQFIITATPDTGSAFTGWTGCNTTSGPTDPVTGANTVCNVTTSADKTVTGHFTKSFVLTVTGTGNGSGNMSAPAPTGTITNINCGWNGTATSGTCAAAGLDTSTYIITATPSVGSTFVGWTGCDSTGGPTDPVTGANTVCTVTTSSAKTVTGNFARIFLLTVAGAGSGTGTMVAPAPTGVISGISCTSTAGVTSGDCTQSAFITSAFVITATPNAGTAFSGWTGCDTTSGPTDPITGADTVCNVTTSSAKTVTGTFRIEHVLTVTGAGNGTGTMTAPQPVGAPGGISCGWNGAATTGAPCSETAADTTQFIITATPDAGSAFTGWTGCNTTSGPTDPITGANTVCNVTTSTDKTVTGHFQQTHALTVKGTGDGTGTMVAPTPTGVLGNINCAWDGNATSGTCAATGLDTTTFVITATPDAGSAFVGWTGCDSTGGPTDPVTGANTVCTVMTSSTKTVIGNFAKVFVLTVNGAGSGTGTMVAPAPAGIVSGISCTSTAGVTTGDCTQTAFENSAFVITATPNAGTAFIGWIGCDTTSGPKDPTTGANTICNVTTSSAKTVTGVFGLTHVLTVTGADDGTGTMTAPQPVGAPGGISCGWNGTATTGTPCSEVASDTTQFVITATAAAGSAFTGWTGCDTTSGPTDPITGANTVCNVTTSADKTVTGHFQQTHALTVKGSGPGTGTMIAPTPAGATGGIDCAWNGKTTTGTACSRTATDTTTFVVTATATGASAFTGWTGCDSTGGPTDPVTGANTVCTVTTSSARTITANFVKTFLLTVAGSGNGTGTMVAPAPTGIVSGISCTSTAGVTSGDCTQAAFSNSVFIITATPDANSEFSGWTGCTSTSGPKDPVTGANLTCHVTTNKAKTVTGKFIAKPVLNVTLTGGGDGSAADTKPGGTINCAIAGGVTSGDCTEQINTGTAYAIVATPVAGSAFMGWTGCQTTSGPKDPITGANRTCNLKLNTDTTVTGDFELVKTLTVSGAGPGSGTMVATGAINCAWNGTANSGDCAQTAPVTTVFTIKAAPKAGFALVGWTGCDTTDGPTDPTTGAATVCHVKLAGDQTVTATFSTIITLTVTGTGTGGGTMVATGLINCAWNGTNTSGTCVRKTVPGTAFEITAAPDATSAFTGWTGCDSTTGANNEVCHVTVNASRTVTASFAPNPILTVAGGGAGLGAMVDTVPGGTINCTTANGATTGDCTQQAASGTVFNITATASDPQSTFVNWTGCDSTSGPGNSVCQVTLNGNKTVTANFTSNCGLLLNCSFETPTGSGQIPTAWTGVKLAAGSKDDTTTAQNGSQSFSFVGNGKAQTLRQTIAYGGAAGSKLTLTYWTKSLNTSKSGLYRIQVTLLKGKKVVGTFFINDPFGTYDWSQRKLIVTAKQAFTSVRIDLTFSKKGTAWYDFMDLEPGP